MTEERLQKLRSHLQLSKNLVCQSKNIEQEQLNSIKKLWEEQEKLMFNCEQPTMQEMVLDLQVIENTGSYIGQFIKTVQANTTDFSPSDYARRLANFLTENNEIQWDKLTNTALPIINRAPGISLMLGTFKPNEQQVMLQRKKRAINRNKNEIVEKQTAEQVNNIEQDDESVDVKVTHIINVLKKCYKKNGNNPIGFYRFVLHPTDFTTTVENIFYISFIIRDGLACVVDLDSYNIDTYFIDKLFIVDLIDEEFVILPMETKLDENDTKIIKYQMIFSITVSQWQELVIKYGIKQPEIV
ncbi:hypothetical protein PGB90_001054 [Kerria lacca]